MAKPTKRKRSNRKYPKITWLLKTEDGKNVKGYDTPYVAVTTAERNSGRGMLIAVGEARSFMGGFKNVSHDIKEIPLVQVKTTSTSLPDNDD